MFYIGQEVVCVKESLVTNMISCFKQNPVVGATYHIRDIQPLDPDTAKFASAIFGDGLVELTLVELVNHCACAGREIGFISLLFRPVTKEEKETDISVFENIRKDVEAQPPKIKIPETV